MSVKISTDTLKIKKRIKAGCVSLKEVATEAIIQFGNEYCPQDSGDLQRSAISASLPKEGEAIWDKEYAAINYYGVDRDFSKDRNSLASAMWAHEGVNAHKSELDVIAQRGFERGMK